MIVDLLGTIFLIVIGGIDGNRFYTRAGVIRLDVVLRIVSFLFGKSLWVDSSNWGVGHHDGGQLTEALGILG